MTALAKAQLSEAPSPSAPAVAPSAPLQAQCSAPWMLLLLAIALTLWSRRNWVELPNFSHWEQLHRRRPGPNKLEDINVTFSRYSRKLAYLQLFTAQSATYPYGEHLSEVEMYGNAFGSIFERELFEAFAWGIELMELR
ncbi:hypothetical protein NEUTE1DRAFT_102068 [Neurospora tetrasperma FGSC 2508]|uniref:Uncharacterized protein n=1 Tax=Neurospora tetrasperma (strain FGSC 2508 / ATCC MYA-4615 / P0657) TaxID=510951 RepID=F8MR24_NEUT8|nr:uncharacterized protein NEUTE1DRAFT_102068 [Neurospora tetrasperma FGSC 2508]EGO56804.1 hypothetical protein NEUTE1DRAFT_102068 [Neurospora tetrasperma FGSC 2508]